MTEALSPTLLEIVDDSTSHAEHEAMKEYGYNETHFKVLIVSEAFNPKVKNTHCSLLCFQLLFYHLPFGLDARTKAQNGLFPS